MVYRGKPSKGCKECRSMKIRCGQQTPECAQCVKGKRQCSGYRDQLDLMFLDESSSVKRKAHAGDNLQKDGPSRSQTSLLVPKFHQSRSSSRSVLLPTSLLHPSLEDQAVAFYFANYADAGPKNSCAAGSFSSSLYQQDQPNGAVKTIVRALGLGGLSRVIKDIRMRNAAISNYVSAMSKTNELLRHPTKAKEDTTLFAIMSLAVFESITGCTAQSVAAFAKHIRGIITLLEMRGPRQLDNEVGVLMYLQIRGHLIVTCLQYHITIPPTLLKWSEQLDHLIPNFQPDNKLADIVVEFANLRAGAQAVILKDRAAIISHLLGIDKKLDAWGRSLPPSWEYIEYPVRSSTDDVLGSTIFEYGDVWTCSLYGKWRCLRIFVHEMIIDCITLYDQSNVLSNPRSDTEAQLQESRRMLEVLVSEIAASIPYMVGYRKGEKPPSGSNIPAMGGMLCCWPLFTIGGMNSASDAVRAWSIRRLLSIGADMGIYQAISLAAVLRRRRDIAYWKERLAKEPIEKLPTGDHMEFYGGDVLFEEGSPEWMSRSDLNTLNGQFNGVSPED